ncbi:TPA: MobQ family relaxase [Escherichia coli]|nr:MULTISPECIES: MobQ family relaxase [Enterobacteriaceae]ECB0177546.1 conjugal transfer protein [Salmonella enterica subsp. enterica serovar Typhimurium]ECH9244215.1 conjugal transfer protein [Salmonella enterica subsp. enterica serovar Abony]EFP7181704.1 MobA/MobL family protein [Shigella flexneri]EME8387887.1 MobA/MobL family protein [Salmonella enterica]MBD5927367.1 conjugal transfer protein [Salmonella enterica subsp. enterica serovar Enteritidis]MCZ8646249.1 MobA/MobL family protein [Es
MAIYHLSMKILSRSKGYSAVASAAYRAGEKILDERTGVIHDYTRKNGVASAVILTPANAPAWCANRAELWNAVEKAERRKNSQLAREFELAIPRELAQDAARETVLNFVRENFVSRGMIADVAFHNLGGSNPHAHIMLSMRAITPDGFGEKVREWNDWTHAETWRGSWADHANRALANAGYQEEIDHRSYERQGVEKTPGIHLGKSACAMEKWGIETERGEQNRLINRLNLEIQVSRDELRNSELTEPARRMADLLNIELPDNATSYILHDIIEALPTDSNAAWKLTSKAMSMMADMQATRRRWEDLNTERKEAMSHAARLKKSSPFSSGFSRIPLMQWVAPEYGREQEKIQSLSQRMEKLRQHHWKVEKQDIPASQKAFETQWQQWGASGLADLREQLRKREEELRRKEQEETERRRAEQLRRNDNAVMDSGVLKAVVTGYGEAPMPGNGEMTCYLLLHNRNGEYTLWGNELEKYRARIFESVDLMRDRSGYICERSEIGQRPPLQHVYSSATFEQLLTQVCQTWPQHTRDLRQPKTWPESFCLGEDRQPAMPSLAARKVDFTQGRLPPTLMPVMSSVDRETRQLQLLLVMGVDDSMGGVVRLNGTLYPAFAVPTADNSQLVINALTDKGLRFAGYGEAVNHDADSPARPAPELMQFHLKTWSEPLFAIVNTPEKQPDHLFRSLGFERTWDEWQRDEYARTHATERRHDRGWSQ